MTARQCLFTWLFLSEVATILFCASPIRCQKISEHHVGGSLMEAGMPVSGGEGRPSENVFHIRDGDYLMAYKDVVAILQNQNPCSEFFGAPAALEVFRQLASQMTRSYSLDEVGIRMHGPQTIFVSRTRTFRYRLFEKAEINGRGSFFHLSGFGEMPRTPSIGRFTPNTREARALMLLHELGHLISTPDGHWLLPDDGGDQWQSQENTRKVLKHCEQTIRSKPGSNKY